MIAMAMKGQRVLRIRFDRFASVSHEVKFMHE